MRTKLGDLFGQSEFWKVIWIKNQFNPVQTMNDSSYALSTNSQLGVVTLLLGLLLIGVVAWLSRLEGSG
jgi:hypothetical protein